MMHNYGIEDAYRALRLGRNFDYHHRDDIKKVMLINITDCQDKLTVDGTHKLLMGMGKMEWELQEALWLVEAVVAALDRNAEVADISKMFNHDMLGWWSREDETPYVKKAEEVSMFLLEKLFKGVDETPKELRVKIVNIA